MATRLERRFYPPLPWNPELFRRLCDWFNCKDHVFTWRKCYYHFSIYLTACSDLFTERSWLQTFVLGLSINLNQTFNFCGLYSRKIQSLTSKLLNSWSSCRNYKLDIVRQSYLTCRTSPNLNLWNRIKNAFFRSSRATTHTSTHKVWPSHPSHAARERVAWCIS